MKHGHTTKFTQSRTYNTYYNMLARCHRESHTKFPQYGGAGIFVCQRWRESFENFLADMGERPPNTTLDRIDGTLGYGPTNCRWATPAEQQSNLRTNVMLTHNGKTQCLSAWARDVGMDSKSLSYRLKNGWTTEQALTTAKKLGNRVKKTGQRLFEHRGKTQCLSHWAKEYDMSLSLLRLRLQKGMTISEALMTPKGVFVTKAIHFSAAP